MHSSIAGQDGNHPRKAPTLGALFLILLGVACTTSTGPSEVSGSVVAASASVSPTSGSGGTDYVFTAVIATNGPTAVSYRWEHDDGVLGPVETINFSGASTQSVAHAWTPGACFGADKTRWSRVVVMSPNALESNHAEIELDCVILELYPMPVLPNP